MLKYHLLATPIIIFALSAWADGQGNGGAKIKVSDEVFNFEEVDIEAAQKIFQKSCRACHGNKAQGAASYPKLSDKEPQYIAEKLEIYRAGQKIGPNSILMIQHAKKLSDEDIANISVYVATAFE